METIETLLLLSTLCDFMASVLLCVCICRKPGKSSASVKGMPTELEKLETSDTDVNKDIRDITVKEKMTWDTYQSVFFTRRSHGNADKSGFTVSSELLRMLRDVTAIAESKTTLTAYIENIILEHLKDNQEMLNKTVSRYRRNQTLNL